MRKFSVNCNFNGELAPFTIYIGEPEENHHPLHFQSEWLSKERGGQIPGEIMDSISKLQELSKQNNIPLEDLCVYALGAADEDEEMEVEDQVFEE